MGRVSEITWSKVQATPVPLARAQVYALRQLDAIAEELETTNVGDLAQTSEKAEIKVQEWLAVLARCFQLQDAVAVLELDRVLDASPDELEEHRVAIRVARQNSLELISRSTERLMTRMDTAARTANAKVLLNPTTSRAVVHSTNHVEATVADFIGRARHRTRSSVMERQAMAGRGRGRAGQSPRNGGRGEGQVPGDRGRGRK